MVMRRYNTQLVFIDAHSYNFESLVFGEMCIFILYVKNTFNPIRIDKQYRVPSYQFKLMEKMETHIKQQQKHHPLNVMETMKRLGASKIKQLTTIQGFSRYLIGSIKN